MSVLDEAKAVTSDPRPSKYGPPHANHGCTAALMEAYLRKKYGAAAFDALDVCAFNMLQKISRLAHTKDHRDSLVDICGYAANWEMILERWAADSVSTEYVDLAGG